MKTDTYDAGARTIRAENWYLSGVKNTGPGYSINHGRYAGDNLQCFDASTGNLYWADWYSGDLFRIETRRGHDASWNAYQSYVGTFPEFKCATENHLGMTWLEDLMVGFQKMYMDFNRVYTYRPGIDPRPVEHVVPWESRGNSIWWYKISAGKERIGMIGFNYDPMAWEYGRAYYIAELAAV